MTDDDAEAAIGAREKEAPAHEAALAKDEAAHMQADEVQMHRGRRAARLVSDEGEDSESRPSPAVSACACMAKAMMFAIFFLISGSVCITFLKDRIVLKSSGGNAVMNTSMLRAHGNR